MVQGCTRTKQTFWTEDEFTVTASSGIRNRDVRVAEIVVVEVRQGSGKQQLCREEVQVGHPVVPGVQGCVFWER